MKGFLYNLYQHSPLWFQNLMVSVKGYQLRRERFGGRFIEYFSEALRLQWLSETELRQMQRDILKKLLKHAYQTVPYYRTSFSEAGVRPEQFKELSDLKHFPILSKEAVRRNSEELISEKVPPRDRLVLHTSGTTGTPLSIYYTADERQKCYAIAFRHYEWAGYRLGMRRAKFGGRNLVPGMQKKPPYWRYDRSQNSLQFSSWHISEQTVDDYLKAMADFKVEFLEGYPSSVSAIARAAVEHPKYKIRPCAVITSAETLLPWQRESISKAFDCPVMDQYGCSEMAVMVYQCREGGYHEVLDLGYAEFIRPEDSAPGTPATVVTTGLLNFTQPLIRYEIGDTVVPDGKTCPCGRGLPAIQSVEGRTDDMLITPKGRLLPRFDVIFKGSPKICCCQIVQDALDHLVFRIVPEPGYNSADGEAIIAQCRARFGDEMRYDIELVDGIELTPEGKFRAVVSKIDQSHLGLFASP